MLHLTKFRYGARDPEYVYRAKFGWLPLSDVAAVGLKAKPHYAIWSQTGPKLVADLQ